MSIHKIANTVYFKNHCLVFESDELGLEPEYEWNGDEQGEEKYIECRINYVDCDIDNMPVKIGYETTQYCGDGCCSWNKEDTVDFESCSIYCKNTILELLQNKF